MPTDPRQKLADDLQAALPLVGRLRVTAQQQQQDAADALAALERAVTMMRAWAPPFDGERRHTANLELAILRSGYALAEVAFLSAIPESRLRALVGGEAPTTAERAALAKALPDWLPGGAR